MEDLIQVMDSVFIFAGRIALTHTVMSCPTLPSPADMAGECLALLSRIRMAPGSNSEASYSGRV